MTARQIGVFISCSHDAVNKALVRFGIGKTELKTGPVPYGWKLKRGRQVPNIGQQKIIKKIQDLKSREFLSEAFQTILTQEALHHQIGKFGDLAQSIEYLDRTRHYQFISKHC